MVGQKLNCEDLLLNWAAAEGIRESYLAAQPIPPLGQPQQAPAGPERWPPHVVWVQPSRRMDISLLSGLRTGISRRRAAHEGARSVVGGGRDEVRGGRACSSAWAHYQRQLLGDSPWAACHPAAPAVRLRSPPCLSQPLNHPSLAATRRECVGAFTNSYGDLLQEEHLEWQQSARKGTGRLLARPICWLPLFGCIYL